MLRLLSIKQVNAISLRIIKQYSHIYNAVTNTPSEQSYIKIQPKAIKLYVDKLFKSKFDEKYFSTLIVDIYRSNKSFQFFTTMLNFAVQNINQTKSFLTICTLMNQIFLYGFKNQQKILIIAKRGFQLLSNIEKTTDMGYNCRNRLRFIIALQSSIGFTHFTNQQYQLISCSDLRPLYLFYVVQLFMKHKLVEQYPFAQKLIQLIIQNKQFIPQKDLYHLKFLKHAAIVSKHSRLLECIQELIEGRAQIQNNIKIKEKEKEKEKVKVKVVKTSNNPYWEKYFNHQIAQKYKYTS